MLTKEKSYLLLNLWDTAVLILYALLAAFPMTLFEEISALGLLCSRFPCTEHSFLGSSFSVYSFNVGIP